MLRRGEKKALNAMNHAVERMRFFVPAPARPQKPKERIQTAVEKIFILVKSIRIKHQLLPAIMPRAPAPQQALPHVLILLSDCPRLFRSACTCLEITGYCGQPPAQCHTHAGK